MAIIEVVYIPADQKPLHAQAVFAMGMTVGSVLDQCGLLTTNPELIGMSVGIFSRAVQLDTLVKPGDRVEIYRPLLLEPMETRRKRARKK